MGALHLAIVRCEDCQGELHGCLAQVLFDTLKYHGASFTAPFWARVFDSVLLPIFDHVRAEVWHCSSSLRGTSVVLCILYLHVP